MEEILEWKIMSVWNVVVRFGNFWKNFFLRVQEGAEIQSLSEKKIQDAFEWNKTSGEWSFREFFFGPGGEEL
jgi:hypothetical protein